MAKKRGLPHEGLAVPQRAHDSLHRRPLGLVVRSTVLSRSAGCRRQWVRACPSPCVRSQRPQTFPSQADQGASGTNANRKKYKALSGVNRKLLQGHIGVAADARDGMLHEGKSGSPRSTGPAAHAHPRCECACGGSTSPRLAWVGRSCPRWLCRRPQEPPAAPTLTSGTATHSSPSRPPSLFSPASTPTPTTTTAAAWFAILAYRPPDRPRGPALFLFASNRQLHALLSVSLASREC